MQEGSGVAVAVARGAAAAAETAAADATVADATAADATVADATVADATVADATVADATVADANAPGPPKTLRCGTSSRCASPPPSGTLQCTRNGSFCNGEIRASHRRRVSPRARGGRSSLRAWEAPAQRER